MDNHLETLQFIGLTSYESKIYLSLVGDISMTIKDIVSSSGVPRTACYDALQRLEKEDWISKNNERPAKYYANDPNMIFGRVKSQVVEKINKTEDFLQTKWNKREKFQTEPVSVIQGSDFIINQTTANISKARESIFLVVRFIIPGEIESLLETLILAKKRGIQIRILLFTDIYEKLPENLKNKFKELGNVRLGPVPIRALVIDQKKVYLSFVPVFESGMEFPLAQTVVISYESFTGMMQQSLNISWESFEQI